MSRKAKFGAQRKEVKQAKVVESPARRTHDEKARPGFFDPEEFTEEKWQEHWWGMPSFIMGNSCPMYQVIVNFFSFEDMQEFGKRLGADMTPRTRSMWFPKDNAVKPADWEWTTR